MDIASNYEPVGDHTEVTVSTTVVTLTPPARANAVMIQNVDASDDLRYTLDGSEPTSSHGFILYHSVAATPEPGPRIIPLRHGRTVKMLRAASADVSVIYQFLKVHGFR